MPKPIGSFALREKGGAVCALADGFHMFDFATGVATPVKDAIVAKPGTNFNDGKTDARGRFIANIPSIRNSRNRPRPSSASIPR